jgi:outer membrane autotransporter protein
VEFIEHFLLYDFALTNDATAVSVVSEAALEGEIGSAVEYAGIQGIRAGFNGMQNAAFVRTKQLRRNTVATDHAISHEAYLMQSDDAPSGPQGPGDQNTIFGMHFWAEQFSGQGDYDAMGNSDGFTLNNNGTTFGFDKLIGDSLVAGVNYTYARSSASAIGGDRAETETYWLGLYGEWVGKADYYLEGLFGLGRSDYNTVRTDGGYRGEGSFSGNDIGVHLEGGKYFHRNSWAVAPYVGLNYLWIKSDAYTETDLAGGLSVSVDEATATSLESALGIKLRNRFDTKIGRFQTVGYAEWAYDFINDDMGSTLSDGTVTVGTARIAPGASLLNAGLGFSWICTDYLEVGLGYDGRFNENYEEHMGSAMLDVRF